MCFGKGEDSLLRKMLTRAAIHQRKALEIIFEKQVNIQLLMLLKSVIEYNAIVNEDEQKLTKDEFRILKEVEVLVKHESNSEEAR